MHPIFVVFRHDLSAYVMNRPPGAMNCLPRRSSPERRRVVFRHELAGPLVRVSSQFYFLERQVEFVRQGLEVFFQGNRFAV